MPLPSQDVAWATRMVLVSETHVERQRVVVAALRMEGRLTKAAEGLLEHCEQLLVVQKNYLSGLERRGGKTLKDLRDEIDRKSEHPTRRRTDLKSPRIPQFVPRSSRS